MVIIYGPCNFFFLKIFMGFEFGCLGALWCTCCETTVVAVARAFDCCYQSNKIKKHITTRKHQKKINEPFPYQNEYTPS